MVKIECGTIRCQDKVKFYNTSEECYYCKECALTLFNENECIKIGSLNDIQRLLEVCNNLWDEVQMYVIQEQLALKWRLELDAHKVFQIEINCITNELNDILMNGKLINLSDIYKRTSNLKYILKLKIPYKYQITESQIFIKYLKHKQLIKHINKECKFDKKKLVTKTVCDLAELRAEENRLMLRDRFQMWADRLGPRSSDILYLEEFRKTHEAEMNEIKNKGEKDIEALQNENAKLHAKIVEDREELNEYRRKYNDYINTSFGISYDVCLKNTIEFKTK